MKLVVNNTGIRQTLKFPGTARLVSKTADTVAEEAAAAGGASVTDIVFPEQKPEGQDFPGAMRRSDEMGRNRAHSRITATHPNNARRARLREILQDRAAALTEFKRGSK
jgi:hypothetical protein